jgi:hypothetical protein
LFIIKIQGQAQTTMADALPIGSISSKHQAMADRLRILTAEWRSPGKSVARRDSILDQVRMFTLRIAWISRAHVLLFYVATACSLAMVPVIALSLLSLLSLPLLLAGVIPMLMAITPELLHLGKTRDHRTRAQRHIEFVPLVILSQALWLRPCGLRRESPEIYA